MYSIGLTTRRHRSSRMAVLAAGIALVVLSFPGAATVGRSAPTAVEPADTFTWVLPTKEPPAVNRPHAGTRVGVHFWLGGDFGLDVIAPGWPRAQRVDCQTRVPIEGTQWRTHPYGSAGVEYDPDTGNYAYVWEVRPEWGNGALRCRQFLLKTTDGAIHELSFQFRSAPATEPPPNLACADITDGNGSYASMDANGDPLPDPKVSFAYVLAAPSCAPRGGVTTRYRFLVLPADADGKPTSWLPIARQVVIGDGVTQVLTFDLDITDDPPPPSVCVFGDVRRGNRIVETVPAPAFACFDYGLDDKPTGRSGWN